MTSLMSHSTSSQLVYSRAECGALEVHSASQRRRVSMWSSIVIFFLRFPWTF
jgi:hypothetical protein